MSTFEDLRADLHGQMIRPGDVEYDEARALWNGMIDKRPAAIARCVSTADVVAAVTFARNQGVPFAVRGGGHNAAGSALVETRARSAGPRGQRVIQFHQYLVGLRDLSTVDPAPHTTIVTNEDDLYRHSHRDRYHASDEETIWKGKLP